MSNNLNINDKNIKQKFLEKQEITTLLLILTIKSNSHYILK